jgi:hypothetical protein
MAGVSPRLPMHAANAAEAIPNGSTADIPSPGQCQCMHTQHEGTLPEFSGPQLATSTPARPSTSGLRRRQQRRLPRTSRYTTYQVHPPPDKPTGAQTSRPQSQSPQRERFHRARLQAVDVQVKGVNCSSPPRTSRCTCWQPCPPTIQAGSTQHMLAQKGRHLNNQVPIPSAVSTPMPDY